jgi:eukaryotic-like serine/threonine-protein kinase
MTEDGFDALLRRAFELPPAPTGEATGELKRCTHCGVTVRADRLMCPADGHLLVPVSDPRIGRVVAGHYRLVERLGSGGIGTVYRARHRVVGREVAVKFLRPELAHQPEHRARLQREAQIVGQLHHEHIVSLIDFADTEGEQLVLVMEYLRGRTLAAAIDDGPFSARRVLHVATQMARALARAHELDVLHRDIKPSNVLLCNVDHDPDFVKLLDFGVAWAQAPFRLTSSHTTVGTPHYMSPEQSRGGDLSPASDLYGLGCVMFEMLTGKPPFEGSVPRVLQAHVMQPPPQLSERAPQTPPGLADVVMRLLQKSPEARYRDAHHLLQALEALASAMPREHARMSSLPSPSVGPAAFGPSSGEQIEQRWADQLELHARAAQARFGNLPPADVRARLQRARDGLVRLAVLREQLATEVARSEALTSEQRALAMRLGAALDSLARDDSAAARELAGFERELAAAEREQENALEVLCRADTAHLAPLVAGEPLDAMRTRALSDLVHAARELSKRSGAVSVLRRERVMRQTVREDLSFQIQQLKGRFGTLHAEARATSDEAHTRASGLDSRYQAELEEVAAALDALALQLV